MNWDREKKTRLSNLIFSQLPSRSNGHDTEHFYKWLEDKGIEYVQGHDEPLLGAPLSLVTLLGPPETRMPAARNPPPSSKVVLIAWLGSGYFLIPENTALKLLLLDQ